MADFSLDLNEDQLQIQKWVHDFAEDVIRPAAHEWDEREETPWPIIEEAAKIGLYSMEFGANAFADPTGLTWPIVSEEMCWGDAGIALAIFGSTLARVRHHRQRHARADRRVGAAVLRHAREDPARRLLRERARRRQRRELAAHARGLRRGEGRVGAQRHQDVDHERRHRRRARRGRVGRARARGARARRASSCRRARPGLRMGQKFKKHGIRASHTAEVILDDVRVPGSCLLGGKEKLDERLARAREGGSSRVQAAMSDVRGDAPARRRAGHRHRPRRLRVLARLRQGARAVRPADHREPGHRVQARRHEDRDRRRPGCSCGARRGWRATGKPFENGEGSMSKLKAGETAVRVTERGDPDPRRLRLRPRVPGRALAPRRQDLHDLRGHLRDPAPRDRPTPSPACTFADLIFESARRSGWFIPTNPYSCYGRRRGDLAGTQAGSVGDPGVHRSRCVRSTDADQPHRPRHQARGAESRGDARVATAVERRRSHRHRRA